MSIRANKGILSKKYHLFSFTGLHKFVPLNIPSPNLLQKEGRSCGTERIIKVLLVDDHSIVRKGIRNILDKQNDIEVVGEAADGEQAIELSRKTDPDIILMDINMPGIDGIVTTRRILAEMPEICIIGLSMNNDQNVVEEMKRAGASAYLNKMEAFDSLVATIRGEVTGCR